MKLFSRLFSKKRGKEDLVEISRAIKPIVDKITIEIFASHKDELVGEEITYIVPAVWGANKESELTPTQKNIHQRMAPAIKEIVESLQFERLSPAQEFALGFLVRDLLITKIVYMIESYKNRLMESSDTARAGSNDLNHLDPVGSA